MFPIITWPCLKNLKFTKFELLWKFKLFWKLPIRLCIPTPLILTWFRLCHKHTAALKQVLSCLVTDANWMQGSQHLISLITMVGPLQFDWWSFLFIPKNFFCPNTLLPSIKDSLNLFDKLCRFIIIHKIFRWYFTWNQLKYIDHTV